MIANPLRSRIVGLGLLALGWIASAGAASAQVECTTVLRGFEPPGTDGQVFALCEHDDGTGPALYAGGSFRIAGDAAASCVVRFDGLRWSTLGTGIDRGWNGGVLDLVVFDFGAGPRLVAAGDFSQAGGQQVLNVAAWDGTSWTGIGALFQPVHVLAGFDDGGGARLYAAFGASVVRWNGTAWDTLPSPGLGVSDLEAHDDGSGAALFACGNFGVARWTGTGWVPVGSGLSNGVSELATHDDGTGRKLYAARWSSPSSSIWRWNGTSWDPAGTLDGPVNAFEELDLHDGLGRRLFAGLLGVGAAGARVVRWSGTAWADVASGALEYVSALAAFGGGASRRLYAGASIADATTRTSFGLARAESGAWIAPHPGHGLAPGLNAEFAVAALGQHDFGAGPEILVGGESLSGPPSLIERPVAKWTGGGWIDAWQASTLASVLTFESFELGGVRELFAGIEFGGVWRWNGTTWVHLPSAQLSARDLQVFDAQGQRRLAVAGNAVVFPGHPRALVGTWDGSTWTTIASHTSYSLAMALAAFDDGTGPALYCGGVFPDLGGVAGTNGIARWNGSTWSSVGGGLSVGGAVVALAVHDDGSGPALYAGGQFDAIGGVTISDLARWDGVAWTPVGASGTSGVTDSVNALAVHDGGAGAHLWAGGSFTSMAGVAARGLARWDGTTWTPAAGDADGAVTALASFDENVGSSRVLWAAGEFTSIGGVASSRLARIGCATGAGFPFCFGDAAHGSSACPCANAGASGHGCAVPAAPSGAILGATGSTVPNVPGGVETLVLVASDLPPTTTAVFVQGTRMPPAPFGDGILCLGAPLVRLATKPASGGVARFPETGDTPLSVRGATAFGSGVTRGYQVWFRAASTYCNAGNYGASSGREITW